MLGLNQGNLPGGPRAILLLLPALAAVSFAGFVLLRKHAPSGPEPVRITPGAAASGAPEPPPAPPVPEPGWPLRPAPRDQGTGRLELSVLDDQGRSPGPSEFCVEGAEGGATFGRTDEKGKAVITLPGDPRTGEYRVYAGRLDPGRVLYWARSRFPGTQTSFTVTYHRRSEIQGIASDADGQRLQGAQIRVRVRGIFPAGDPAAAVFQKLMKGPGEWELQRRADAAGMFRLDHLSSDLGLRFDFAALEEGQGQSIETDLSQEADGPSSTVMYRAPAPAQYSVLLTRNRAGVVSASALTWDGLPVPQALLSFRVESGKNSGGLGPRAVLRTDGLGRGKAPWKDLADGSTPFPKGVTRYWAAAWKRGHGLAYSSGTLDPARPEVVVRFPKGQTGPSIQAQVLDQASLAPLRSAEVRITSTLFEKAYLAEFKTDPKGNFSLEGLQAPDASFGVSLEKGFRFFAEVRPPGAGTDPTTNSPDAIEVRPGAPGRILLPRKP